MKREEAGNEEIEDVGVGGEDRYCGFLSDLKTHFTNALAHFPKVTTRSSEKYKVVY